MTNNPTIDGVSRILIEEAAERFAKAQIFDFSSKLRALLAKQPTCAESQVALDAPVVERQDVSARLKQAEQSISNLIGFGFEANEMQTVNAGDLLAVYMAGCSAAPKLAELIAECWAACGGNGPANREDLLTALRLMNEADDEAEATIAHQVDLLDRVLTNASRALPPAVYTDISAAVDRHRAKAPVSEPNETEREPFERWHRNRFATKHTTGAPTRDLHNGTLDPNYGPPHQQHMWEAWQARAALSPALPDNWQHQLFAEMERRFDLRKQIDDEHMVNDDTQIGVEFARDWVAARLAKDQPPCP